MTGCRLLNLTGDDYRTVRRSAHSNEEGVHRWEAGGHRVRVAQKAYECPGSEVQYPGWSFALIAETTATSSSSRRRWNRRLLIGPHLRELRRRLARSQRGSSQTSSTPCRSTSSPRPSTTRVEQHDRPQRHRRRGGAEAQGGDRRDHPGARPSSPARPRATRARLRRRAAPDGIPSGARHRRRLFGETSDKTEWLCLTGVEAELTDGALVLVYERNCASGKPRCPSFFARLQAGFCRGDDPFELRPHASGGISTGLQVHGKGDRLEVGVLVEERGFSGPHGHGRDRG